MAVAPVQAIIRRTPALPSIPYGVRELLEIAARKTSFELEPAIESDSFEYLRNRALANNIATVQIAIGLPAPVATPDFVARPVDRRDVPPGNLYIGQLKGRILPIAAARFADQLLNAIDAGFASD